MKIIYLTNTRVPTEKAHGLATVKICEAFAKQGAEVMLVVPWRRNPLKEDPYAYYGVERNFAIKTLPSIDFLWLGIAEWFFFALQLFSFSISAFLWLWWHFLIQGQKDIFVFSHDHIPLFFASFIAKNLFYDIHHYPEKAAFYGRVLRKAKGIAVQTKWKIQKLHDDFGIPAGKILYWPNGTDIWRFDLKISPEDARKHLGLPQDKKLVVYTGQLFSWKGVDTLVKAVEFMPADVLIYIVGGSPDDIAKFQVPSSKFQVHFAGQRPWLDMPHWLRAADILVLPNTGKENVSLHYTSPMKLFEYMASGTPMVVSDIPSIREIVDEPTAFFAQPDDPRSFADAIISVFHSQEEAQRKAALAKIEVQKYTWETRAEKILSAMRMVLL